MSNNALSLVTQVSQVLANIKKYTDDLPEHEELQRRIRYVQVWYALRNEAEGWIFGPSKFVGYQENCASLYVEFADRARPDGSHGWSTEKILSEWFYEVDSTSQFGQELKGALRKFLAPHKLPSARAKIKVLKDEPIATAGSRRKGQTELASRIVSSPDICGGRPCVKGTRMRVSDLLEMLADGASREEILADFPYISNDDISAALAFGARSSSHRVVRAA